MTFDEEFPSATFGFRAPSGYIKGKLPHKCNGCDQPTSWFYPGTRLYFCSADCRLTHLERAYRNR